MKKKSQKHGPSGTERQQTENMPLNEGKQKNGIDGATVLQLTADPDLRRNVSGMLESIGFRYAIIENPCELWEIGRPLAPACLLCSHLLQDDVTGFHILEGIEQRCWSLPTVLIARQWDIPDVVKAMKSGGENFLTLPLQQNDLLDAVKQGLLRSSDQCCHECAIADAKDRAFTLDARELEVVKRMLRGYLNKEIADELDLALVTIKVYRARAMKKLGAGNPAELARIACLAGLCDEDYPFRLDRFNPCRGSAG